MTTYTLNPDQAAAVAAMSDLLSAPYADCDPNYVLKGYAGTGKTFAVKALLPKWGSRLVFTAPTNKATRVLRETLATEGRAIECRTIYSLLGLTMQANGEVKELKAPEDPIDLSDYSGVVVDEASMLNEQVMGYIRETQKLYKIKFIFMGDPAQLPPVGELRSPVWDLPQGTTLTKVMRYDNSLLKLATSLRDAVDVAFPRVEVSTSLDTDTEGVIRVTRPEMLDYIIDDVADGAFHSPKGSKVIAWRNVAVDEYNRIIRAYIFGTSYALWEPEDRVIFTEPAKVIIDEEERIVATTDEEGSIVSVREDEHPKYRDLKIYRVNVKTDEGSRITALVLHPDSASDHDGRVMQLASEARKTPRLWRNFWEFKEAFHKIRHGYAITAHRSQGSTYHTAYVDRLDILRNQNRQEAYRCLYVACTRAQKRVITL
jgi:hypothetical protein